MRAPIRRSIPAIVAILVVAATPVLAQPALSVGADSGALGSVLSVPIELTVDSADGIVSWSFSLCHDDLIVDPVGVVPGTALQTLGAGGGAVAFEETVYIRNDLSGFDSNDVALLDVDPTSSSGVAQVVITDLNLMTPLPTGPVTIATIDYEAVGVGVSSLDFCATVAPQTGSFRLTEVSNSTGVTPSSTSSGSATVTSIASLAIPSSVPLVPMGQVTIPVLLTSPTEPVNGFQFGITHDPLVVTPLSASLSPGLGIAAPAFFGSDIDPVNGDGVVVIALLATTPPFDSIAPGSDIEIVEIVYAAAPGATSGDATALEFSDTLEPEPSTLPSMISVAFEFSTEVPITAPGSIVIDQAFVRGEIDGNPGIGLPDAISLLQALFGPTMPTLLCSDAADLNDDGALGVIDVIALLNTLIGSNPMVPDPSPLDQCGFDPTPDSLDCDTFDAGLCP